MEPEEEKQEQNQITQAVQQQAKQATKQLANQAKQVAKDAAKKLAKKAMGFLLKNPYVLAVIGGIIIVLLAIILITNLVHRGTVAQAAELMELDISKYITIEGDHFKIDNKLYELYAEKLRDEGLDGGTYLNKDSKYLKAIIKAELVTTYPMLKNEKTNLETNEFQGIVQIIRRSYEADDNDRYTKDSGIDKEILLTYIEEKKFNQKLEKAKEGGYNQSAYDDLKQYYTIPKEEVTKKEDSEEAEQEQAVNTSSKGVTIIIPTYNGSDVGTEKISYQNTVNKYSVPVEFLIAQLNVTTNPEYIYSMADMAINNSKIELVIQETYSYNYTYTETIEKEGEKPTVSSNTSESFGIIKYIRNADSLAVKGEQKYVKNDTRYQEHTEGTKGEVGTYRYTKTGSVTYNSTPFNNSGNTVSSGSASGESGDGYDSVYTSSSGKSYREYKQYIYKQVYGENSDRANWLSKSGCGLTSAAIIISAYDTNINPVNLYDNYRAVDGSVNIDKYLSNSGITFNHVNGFDTNRLGAWLCEGNSAIVCLIGNANVNGVSWAGGSGHYITMLDGQGSNGNYQVYISNPGHNNTDKNGWYALNDFSGVIQDVYYINK